MAGATTRDPRAADVRRLLIVKTSSIGDVIHALPIARLVKRDRPDIHIGWVVRERCADLLVGNPDIDETFVMPDRPRLGDLLRLSSRLRAARFDTAMDMQGLLLSGIVTWLSGARRRIGLDLDRERNTLFLNEPVVPARADRRRHAIDILRGFLPILGLPMESGWPKLDYLSAGAAAPQELATAANRGEMLIALNPGASSIYKQWPQERWEALARRIQSSGAVPVIVGGPQDRDAARAVEAAAPGAVNLAGRTTLRESAAALHACDLLVTADTGPMHMAVAVGTPVVALFGPTDPARTGPYGEENTVVWKQIACAPCFRRPTCAGRVDCMKKIGVDEVFDSIASLLPDRRVVA